MILSFVPVPATAFPVWTGACVEVCVCIEIVGEPPTQVLAAMPAIICGPADMLACVHHVGLPVIFPTILCVLFAVFFLTFYSVRVPP